MKQTILHSRHVALGAKLAPFGGYIMPIQYSGIIHEHQATRSAATVFDTCHMGEFKMSGPTAMNDLERLVTCRVYDLAPGRCRYGMMCNETGGVIDDLLVYRLAEDEFMLVVNAGTQEDDFSWIHRHLSAGTRLLNRSETMTKIDVQGPHAPRIATAILERPVSDLVFYSFAPNRFRDHDVLVSRTGYTGEIGFEFYAKPAVISMLWDCCIDHGAVPAGLGARDTLRLEMGMPLYGHELSATRNAAETGFQRAFDLDKDFIGADAVRQPPEKRICGVRISGKRAARQGDEVFDGGTMIGEVTSGSFAPSVGAPVALARVRVDDIVENRKLTIRRGTKEMTGTVVSLPFYTHGTARKKMSRFLN